MINIDSLKRQHNEISEAIKNIKTLITGNNLESEANEAALLINTLAGKLKIHLNTEDKYMYPVLLRNESSQVRNTAGLYIDEMGEISEVFTQYKEKYNTRSKITADIEGFKAESSRVFSILEDRIAKEEASLYPIL